MDINQLITNVDFCYILVDVSFVDIMASAKNANSNVTIMLH